MYRRKLPKLEVFLVHPGGPFFAKKDAGAWTIPKGEYLEGESPLQAAQREFQEETGFTAHKPFLDLGSIQQKGGKIVCSMGLRRRLRSRQTNQQSLRNRVASTLRPFHHHS